VVNLQKSAVGGHVSAFFPLKLLRFLLNGISLLPGDSYRSGRLWRERVWVGRWSLRVGKKLLQTLPRKDYSQFGIMENFFLS
ncbi:MAG: hypothetical protein N2747_10055, partial [Chitinophagaceae bacterium]|nr:hypothetical protein [Chitinophagaceae bacterium]